MFAVWHLIDENNVSAYKTIDCKNLSTYKTMQLIMKKIIIITCILAAQPASWSGHVLTFPSVDRLGGNAFAAWGDSHNLLLQKNGAPACIGAAAFGVSPGPINMVSSIIDVPVRTDYTVTGHHIVKPRNTGTIIIDCNITY